MTDMASGKRSRIPWLVIGLIMVLAAIVAAILLWRNGTTQESLTVVSWGGTTQDAMREAIFKPFTKASGITIKEDSYNGELELIRDMVEQHTVRWDVVHVEDDMMLKALKEGWLEKVPADAASNPKLREFSEGYGVPIFAWGTVLAWNKDRLQAAGVKEPSSWSALWYPAYPGPIGLRKSPIGTVEIALLAKGYNSSNLYPLNRDKVSKALSYLDSIRSKISWWSGGAEHQQKLLTEYTLAATWSGRVWVMMQKGEHVDMTYNQGLVRYDWWVIPKGTQHSEKASEFLRFATRPEIQAHFCELTGYGPGTSAARNMLSERLKRYAPKVEGAGGSIVLDGKWWADNIGWVQDMWIQWLGQ